MRSVASVAQLRSVAVLVALFFACLVLLADTSKARAQNSVSLPAIDVVSATLVPTPSSQIASSVTVITADDLERDQRRTVPDALNAVPGLNVVQTGGPGGQTSVFIRGTNSNHVKVLIDGIEVADPSNANRAFDFGQLLTNDIERIEVLRGPQSGLYGADAIGGVISITTKKGSGPLKAKGTVEGGSFGTFNQYGGVSGSQDRFNYSFNIAHFRAPDTEVTPSRILPPGRPAFGNFYDNKTYSSKLGVDMTENFSINWVGRYTDSLLRFTRGAVPNAFQSRQDVNQFHTRGEAVVTLFDGRLKNYLGVNFTDHWTSVLSPGVVTPAINQGYRRKYDWRGVVSVVPAHTVIMGLEKDSETMQATGVSAENGNKAGYVELQSEIAQRIFLAANARRDSNERFGGRTTYRVAPAVIAPVTETKFKASYGTGFKPPSLFQLFFQSPFFNGNPNLSPETSRGYDYGFEQSVANDRFRFGVTRYRNKIENLIASDPTFTTLINVDRSSIYGYEAFAALNVNSQLSFRSDYTYTHVEASADPAIVRRVPHKYSLTSIWTPITPLQLSATIIRSSSWRDFDRVTFETVNQAAYTTVNLAANYIIDQHVTVFGRADNLLNQHYENPNGFLRPGFAIYAGMRVSN